jgi:3-phosphoshikimate 1-carboxyvinyltransferase
VTGAAPTTVWMEPVLRVGGEVTVPGDKSISHRALILASLARGRSYIGNLSPAADVGSTAACLRECGAYVREFGAGRVVADGSGPGVSLRSPAAALDCGNSGTTMRLLAGVLAGHDRLEATLDGDASLRARPMERVAAPLRSLGAEVEASDAGRPPLRVRGRRPLLPGRVVLPVASAQLKSALLLAGVCGDAEVTVVEPAPTRDHTERMLRMCGVDVVEAGAGVSAHPGPLTPFGMRIPGDLSSAAFLLALAAARPGWWVRCPGVTLNPGRTGFLDVLRAMGVSVEVEEGEAAGGVEPVGCVAVRGDALRSTRVGGELVPRCIDEIPVLAVLATQAEGVTEIRDAGELRVKESDRIAAVAAGLRALGADVEELPDGLDIAGPTRLHGGKLDAGLDHRLAMAWAVAACLAGEPCQIDGADAVAVSYPGFFGDLARVALG